MLLGLAQYGVRGAVIQGAIKVGAILHCRQASAQPAHVPVAAAEDIIILSRVVADCVVVMLKK